MHYLNCRIISYTKNWAISIVRQGAELMTRKHLSRWVLLWITCIFCIGGCTSIATPVISDSDETPPTQQAVSSPTPMLPSSAEAASTPESMFVETDEDDTTTSITPDGQLSKEGPWWIFSTDQGLWAVNPDGTGLKRISSQEFKPPFNRQIVIAPRGGAVAFINGRDWMYDVTLRIIELPYPTMITEKPLTSEKSEPGQDAMPGDPSVEAVRAMVDIPSIAFSPDGEYLAFMGAINGPTSDLYVYSMEQMAETQLTDGPSQGIKPVWSPDGKYIVHAGVSSLGTGAGYSMEGFWAARADDSDIITLFDPSDTGDQVVIGWVDESTFVVYSWTALCGPSDLRTFNIETLESHVLWDANIQQIAYNPIHAVALLAVNDDYEMCNPEAKLGLFIVPANGSLPLKILDEQVYQVSWSQEAELFFASTEFGIVAVDSLGQYIDLDVPAGSSSLPVAAPDTRELVWIGEGLWIGPLLGSIENPPIKFFNQRTYNATWDPEGEYVLFFSDTGLYVAQKPEYTPILIAEGLDNQNGFSGWVMP
jgi:dipeptidyl aminopeptidase/acylaminoacyl peptidase